MNTINATTYKGLSAVSGSISIKQLFELIRSNTYRERIQRLRLATEAGENDKADRMKRQLPYHTVTATYSTERLACSLATYQDIITLDCDEMPAERLPEFRRLTNECPDTIGSFTSPRMHGLKIFVYLKGREAEALRTELNARGTIDFATLNIYHRRMYALACRQYEQLLGTKVDSSGSDIGRGFFVSYDPEAFLSDERLAAVRPLTVTVTLPTREACKSTKRKSVSTPLSDITDNTAHDAADASSIINLQVQLDFRKAMDYTRRKERLVEGNRDNFFYCLGNQCYQRHITEQEALALTGKHFTDLGGFDFATPLRNAYRYTSKTDNAEEHPKEPRINQLIRFMDTHYEIQRNVVKEQLEFRRITPDASNTPPQPFITLRAKDINTFYINAQLNGISCSTTALRALVDSDYAQPFNPLLHYFNSLAPWDGKTDHIGILSRRVHATDQQFFDDSFRRWIVGMVACAIDDDKQNHQLLLLHGAQGKGKSTFIRHLLPPELKDYYRSNMINPDNKDHLLQLSSCLLINLDEFDTLSPSRMQELKSLITQDVITERKAFDIQTYSFVRRASFVASTNNPQCLPDIGENRRILFNSITDVDYRTPVDHQGIYAQALALYRQGFHYWYENEEVTYLNQRNEEFRQKDPVEESLFFYFRPAKGGDLKAQWYPATYLLSILSLNGRIQSNSQAKQTLTAVLEKHHFLSRKTLNGITEYCVVEYTQDERKQNATLPLPPVQNKLEL